MNKPIRLIPSERSVRPGRAEEDGRERFTNATLKWDGMRASEEKNFLRVLSYLDQLFLKKLIIRAITSIREE